MPQDGSAAGRPFSVKDIYRLQEVGEAVLSPSGNEVAFVIKRPHESAPNGSLDASLNGLDVADVWVASIIDGHVARITDGAVDGTGFWAPRWSADSRKIAMLSTRAGNVYLWVWQRGLGLRRVTRAAVALDEYGGFKYQWISNNELLCRTLSGDRRPLWMNVQAQTPLAAMHAWRTDWHGHTPTVSVLKSGVPSDVKRRPQEQLLIVTIDGNKTYTTTLAHSSQFGNIAVSRDQRFAAVFSQVDVLNPRAGRKLQSDIDSGVYSLAILDLKHRKLPAFFAGRYVGRSPTSWSHDNTEIAFTAEPATTNIKSRVSVFRCDVQRSRCEDIVPTNLKIDQWPVVTDKAEPLWMADYVVFSACNTDPRGSPDRWDWYGVNSHHNIKNITLSFRSPPTSLVPMGRSVAVAIADGKLIELSPGDGWRPRTLTSPGILTSIAWPTPQSSSNGNRVVLRVAKNREDDLIVVRTNTRQVSRLLSVARDLSLNDFQPRLSTAILSTNGRFGSFLYVGRRGHLIPVFSANTWLENVTFGQLIAFSYKSLTSGELTGWILLPTKYHVGRHYPSIVWVYAGDVYSASEPPVYGEVSSGVLNLQLLAEHGYAVIFPSMPLPPWGHPNIAYQRLADGVLPAIARAAALGYIDPNRVGLLGISYGGFSTYGLITQTVRFKAAIAMAGVSDWSSLYGEYDPRFRYLENINENSGTENNIYVEQFQGNLGGPPWSNPKAYTRNSPMSYVEKVHTPVMIVQGDMDFVPLQQGEQFFQALYRQGKRAELVRYWGEGHTVTGEANAVDLWKRIYAWFDEFLK